jgi:hypothetical protein
MDSSSDDITKQDTGKVIRLNVGGTRYEVSRSLIELYPETMLARMISEEWSSGDDQEVFIDRNGPRFQYVLDYMRDHKTTLAMNVTKESILTELEYFGFANVPSDSIDQTKSNMLALEHIKTTQNNFAKWVEKKQDDWVMFKLASMVYDAQVRSTTLVYQPISRSTLNLSKEELVAFACVPSPFDWNSASFKSALNNILSNFGLVVSSINVQYSPGRCDPLRMPVHVSIHFYTLQFDKTNKA